MIYNKTVRQYYFAKFLILSLDTYWRDMYSFLRCGVPHLGRREKEIYIIKIKAIDKIIEMFNNYVVIIKIRYLKVDLGINR